MLAVFYSFARSGGTLMNRCLGAIAANLVVSEVNPHGALVPVEVQARDWLGLVRPEEFEAFAGEGYGAKIRRLSEAAAQRDCHLVIRDWPALNFLDGLFSHYFQPSLLLEQDLYLARQGLAHRSAVVSRRAAAVYESLVRTFAHLKDLSAETFGASYLVYARSVAGRPVMRFEEFCREPRRELGQLCEWLAIAYQDDFLEGFRSFDRCTGDNRVGALSRAGRSERIEALPENRDSPAWREATRDPACQAADDIFGYA